VSRAEHLGSAGFADGERYHRARPDYPEEAVAYLVAELPVERDSVVVDLGAGTGLFTRRLIEHCRQMTAVEPTAGMRAVLRRTLPEVTVLDGCDRDIPLPDGSVDVVTVALAFHWFDIPTALHEIDRVLRPGGGLGLIWNERDESVPWVAELGRAMRWPEYQPYQIGMDFSPVVADGPFVDVARRRFSHRQVLDHEGLRQRVLTTSYIAVMSANERRVLLADVDEVIAHLPEPVELPYVTDAYRARTASR
jgi:SAM-dependent methyltransferase